MKTPDGQLQAWLQQTRQSLRRCRRWLYSALRTRLRYSCLLKRGKRQYSRPFFIVPGPVPALWKGWMCGACVFISKEGRKQHSDIEVLGNFRGEVGISGELGP